MLWSHSRIPGYVTPPQPSLTFACNRLNFTAMTKSATGQRGDAGWTCTQPLAPPGSRRGLVMPPPPPRLCSMSHAQNRSRSSLPPPPRDWNSLAAAPHIVSLEALRLLLEALGAVCCACCDFARANRLVLCCSRQASWLVIVPCPCVVGGVSAGGGWPRAAGLAWRPFNAQSTLCVSACMAEGTRLHPTYGAQAIW